VDHKKDWKSMASKYKSLTEYTKAKSFFDKQTQIETPEEEE
jgi:hypothetical protein